MKIPILLRNAAFGLLALGVTATALPGNAQAAARPHEIANKIDRVAYKVEHIHDIHSLRDKDYQIDRLQKRLYKLDRANYRYRGRLARKNDHRIERLQYRLDRIERRVEAKLDRRKHRRHDRHSGKHHDRYDKRHEKLLKLKKILGIIKH